MRLILLGLLMIINSLNFVSAQWSPPVQLNILVDPSIKKWPSINAAGDTLYYAKQGANGNENICFSYWIADTTWSAPIFMPPFINTDQREISPSIGPGDSILYFVTYGRPGGYGSYDIWFTRRGSNGQWQEPENAGPNINTAGMEWGVFLSRDGQRLYFSSTRDGTLNIHVSQWQDSAWGEAVFLPGQLNWITDEENVTLASDESYLILTSERSAEWGVDLLRSDLVDSLWTWPLPINDLNYVRDENGASLSPDGLTIYFASERNDSLPLASQLYVSHWTDAAAPTPAPSGTGGRLHIFPNPVNGTEFTVYFPSDLRYGRPEANLYNMLGQRVPIRRLAVQTPWADGQRMQIALDNLPSGRYWLLVQTPTYGKIVPLSILK